MNHVRFEKFEKEGLVKYFDNQNRIVEIAFVHSGNGCTIQYIEEERQNERIVRWNTGEMYRTWIEEGKTKFIKLSNNEKEWHY